LMNTYRYWLITNLSMCTRS